MGRMIATAFVWLMKASEWIVLGAIGFSIFWIMVGIAWLSKVDFETDSADALERTYGDSPTDPQEEPAQ